VTLADYTLDELWVLFGASPNYKESGLNIMLTQNIEDGGCGRGIWPIIESGGDPVAKPEGFARCCKAW
jgi:hypothetical protein